MEILLHPDTKQQLDSYYDNPSHALIIEGPTGSGKGTLADQVVGSLIGISIEELHNYSFLLRIQPVKNVIPISTIRNIQEFIKLKTLGKNPIRRAIIVEDADKMTHEAQNAFLKILEEPPKDTIILLTASNNHALLPTIYSRVQKIQVRPMSKNKISSHFKQQGFDSNAIERAFYISEGNIGLMQALLTDDSGHPLVGQITVAKELLSKNTFGRLVSIDSIAKDRDSIADLLYALQQIYHAVLMQASDKENDIQITKSHAALKKLNDAQSSLSHNPNLKLLLTDLLLNI